MQKPRTPIAVELWVYYHNDPPFLARTLKGSQIFSQSTAIKALDRYMGQKNYRYRIEPRTIYKSEEKESK